MMELSYIITPGASRLMALSPRLQICLRIPSVQ